MKLDILTEVLILLIATVLVVTVFRRLRLPAVLGYLVVGFVVGPFGLGLISAEDKALLAEFGVVFLLFTLGLEFSLPRMMAMKWEVFGLGPLQVLLTAFAFGLGAWWLGLSPGVIVVVSGAAALSSTALVIKQLSDQLEINRLHGRLATGILLFQDLAAVPLLVLIPLLAASGTPYEIRDVVVAFGKGALVLVIVLLTGRYLLRPLFHEIAHGRAAELFTLAVLLIAIGAAWATHAAGLSLALGGFVAGMMLSETEYRHQIETDIRPFRDIFLGLFFITVGMRLDLSILVEELAVIALLLLGLIPGKAVLATLAARRFAGTWKAAARTGLAIAQGGEFGLALISLALSYTVIAPEVAQPVLAALVVSMLLSPFVIRHNAALAGWLFGDSEPPIGELPQNEAADRALAAREHVVICGYGRVGQNVARILEEEGFEYIALDLDPYRIRRAREAGDPVHFGDAARTEMLEKVGLPHASVVVVSFSDPLVASRIVQSVRELRADVPVLVRTQDDTHFNLLQGSGATAVVPEALEASLILAAHVLTCLHVPIGEVLRKIEDIRNHRYSMLRSVFRKEAARPLDETHALREQLTTVVLPAGARAVGQTLAALELAKAEVMVTAIRRDGIVGRQPVPETVLKEGDIVVLYGTPEALEHAETILMTG